MPSKIVGAKEGDVPVLLKLIHELAVYEKLDHDFHLTEEKLRNHLFGARKYIEAILLQENDEKVGFALFFHNYSSFAAKPGLYVEDLYVKAEYRKKKYGLLLLSHLAKIAVERDCARLEGLVLDWNEASIKVYLNLGAKAMDEWTVYRWTGDKIKSLAQLDI